MENVLGRYKNLIILVGVLFLQVLGLAVQVRRDKEATDTRLIRVWAVGAITPFERVVVWMENGTGNIWHNYFYLRGVRAENRQLKDQIEQMRLQQVRLNEDAAQAHRLQSLLNFKEQYISKTLAAQVIGTNGTDLYRVYIDKGSEAGLKSDMAVITADGIVGKVTLVYRWVSEVQLINDPNSGVGGILEKTRLQGVLRGTTDGELMLEHIMSDEQVPLEEKVLTSGGDQIFPKGLPVGTVTKVAPGKDVSLNIKIKPAANLSKLEEVLVVMEQQNRQTTESSTASMRAADILAQRLPSVPEKPAEVATGKSVTGKSLTEKSTTEKSTTEKIVIGTAASNPVPGSTTSKPPKPQSTPANGPAASTATGIAPVPASGAHTVPIASTSNSNGVTSKPAVQTSGQTNAPKITPAGTNAAASGTAATKPGPPPKAAATTAKSPAAQGTPTQAKPAQTKPATPPPSAAGQPAAGQSSTGQATTGQSASEDSSH